MRASPDSIDSFDFAFVDALPARAAGGGELRIALSGPSRDARASLLFIPGAYHGAWCYAGWLKRCRLAGIACAALDYRGHGALAPQGLALDAGVDAYAEDTLAALRRFAAPPILVGHSLGGLVAMAAALRAPLAGLALVAPSPPGNLAGAHAIAPVDPARLRLPPERAELVERFLGGYDGLHVEAYMARLCPESPRALNQRYALEIAIEPHKVTVPVLVVEAGLDCGERHPAGQDEAIARFFGGQFARLASAPHCMMLGPSSEAALDLLLAWRERIGSHLPGTGGQSTARRDPQPE